ncbi:MAG: GtrA family protein [Acidiphilium sp.]
MVETASRFLRAPFIRFLFVGGLNTLFGYGVFAATVAIGLAPELALLAATIVGILFNFVTTGRLVFGSANSRHLPRFCIAYGIVYLMNATAMRLVVNAGVSAFVAEAVLLPVAAIVTFQVMKMFVFAERHT